MTKNIEAIEKKATGHLLIPHREGALVAIFLVGFLRMIKIVFLAVEEVLVVAVLRVVGNLFYKL